MAAEQILVEAYKNSKVNQRWWEPALGRIEIADMSIELYEAWEKPDQVREWKLRRGDLDPRAKLPTEQEAVASDNSGQSSSDENQDE